nr:unnamed protein product [Digitaria exilis]
MASAELLCCSPEDAAAVSLCCRISSPASSSSFRGRRSPARRRWYVGVEEETGTELFYYFVESERSPRTDAVLLWLTGGPRCSAFSGLGFEVGW